MGTLSITTNTSALNVQRNLSEANDRSASSLAKLSSGSRVPTARDDAASLAIGSRLEAEVAGLNQASVNASQATSMLQIADGALSQVNDILVRLKSLSVQSSSGQLSDSERTLLDSEFQQLLSEIDRISDDTEFNGNPLLNGGDVVATTNESKNGSLSSMGISVAYDTNVVNGAQDTDGDGNFDIQGDVFSIEYDSTSETITLTNKTTGELVKQDITTALDAKAGAGLNLGAGKTLDISFADLGVTLTLGDDFARGSDFNNGLNPVVSGATPPTYTGLTATSSNSGGFDSASLIALQAAGAFNATTGNIDLTLTDDGVDVVTLAAAGLEFSTDGGATFTTTTGDLDDGAAKSIQVRLAGSTDTLFTLDATSIASSGSAGTSTLSIAQDNIFGVQEDSQNTATFDYQVGTGTKSSDTISVTIAGASTTSLGINSTNISTQASSKAAIDEIGAAIDTLQDVRAQVGASLSRLDFASSNLSVTIENSESAKSGLLDVDIATETTKYTAEQVIVQAGVSLLAQANQRPSTLLTLLQQ
jgi:flagellin